MERPLVSVLITTYNREKYIGAAIESVLASTIKDFELIISDDCSKDKTVTIAKSYAERDNRVSVFVNETNLGDYPNRNKAASYACGKYLKYVDADDYIYPWGLEILIQCMEQFPEAGWGLCSLLQSVTSPFPFMLNPKEAYLYNYDGPGLFHKAPLSAIIKREIFETVGGFAPLRMSGDFEMWNKLAQRYNVVLMPDGVVWYREHGEQEVKSHKTYVWDYENIRVKYLKDPRCPLSENEVVQVIKNIKKRHLKSFFLNVATLRLSQAMDSIRLWRYYIGK